MLCRLCRAELSFANSSFNSAQRHARAHGLPIDDAEALEALAELCGKWEAKGTLIPEEEWQRFKVKAAEPSKVKVEAGPSCSKAAAATITRYYRVPSYAPGSEHTKRIKKAMAKWIAADGIQLRVCETEHFREFCRALDGKCPAIGRKAITNQIHTFYEDAVKRLAQDGKWRSYRPAFTCDLWKGPGPKEYMTLTAHWVEPTPEEFTLRMRVLGSFAVPEVSMTAPRMYFVLSHSLFSLVTVGFNLRTFKCLSLYAIALANFGTYIVMLLWCY